MYVTWVTHVFDMTYPCVWLDVFMCVTWLVHLCHITPLCSRVWHDSLVCVAWLAHTCDMTHLSLYYLCKYVRQLVYVRAHARMRLFAWVYICIHTYIYTNIYTYVYRYIGYRCADLYKYIYSTHLAERDIQRQFLAPELAQELIEFFENDILLVA